MIVNENNKSVRQIVFFRDLFPNMWTFHRKHFEIRKHYPKRKY